MLNRRHFLSAALTGLGVSQLSLLAAAWNTSTQLPYAVQEIYPVLHNGNIVVAGGIFAKEDGTLGVTERVVAFNLKTQKWQNLPSLPEARHHPMCCSVAGRLYAFSGFVSSESATWIASRDVLLLDEEAGKWVPLENAEMPFPMCETVSMVAGNKVHLATGRRPTSSSNSQWRDHSDINHHLVFDITTQRWTEAPPAPTARNSAAGAVVDGLWYVVGGRTVADGNKAYTEVYNPATNKWSTRSDMPQAQGGLAAASVKNKLYVFGGEFFNDGGGVYSEVWQYTPERDYWQQVSFMPVPRHGLGAIAVENDIYLIAGAAKAGGNETSSIMSVFRLSD